MNWDTPLHFQTYARHTYITMAKAKKETHVHLNNSNINPPFVCMRSAFFAFIFLHSFSLTSRFNCRFAENTVFMMRIRSVWCMFAWHMCNVNCELVQHSQDIYLYTCDKGFISVFHFILQRCVLREPHLMVLGVFYICK